MRTYDDGAGTHGKELRWRDFKDRIIRWFNREREIIALRNAVGMMSEARRADAAEYEQMRQANRTLYRDALRFQWLVYDHDDKETRELVRRILDNMKVRSLSGTRMDIDANISDDFRITRE